jgi:hypothetical protein
VPFGARVQMIPCAVKLQSACVAVYERWNFFLRSTTTSLRRPAASSYLRARPVATSRGERAARCVSKDCHLMQGRGCHETRWFPTRASGRPESSRSLSVSARNTRVRASSKS